MDLESVRLYWVNSHSSTIQYYDFAQTKVFTVSITYFICGEMSCFEGLYTWELVVEPGDFILYGHLMGTGLLRKKLGPQPHEKI